MSAGRTASQRLAQGYRSLRCCPGHLTHGHTLTSVTIRKGHNREWHMRLGPEGTKQARHRGQHREHQCWPLRLPRVRGWTNWSGENAHSWLLGSAHHTQAFPSKRLCSHTPNSPIPASSGDPASLDMAPNKGAYMAVHSGGRREEPAPQERQSSACGCAESLLAMTRTHSHTSHTIQDPSCGTSLHTTWHHRFSQQAHSHTRPHVAVCKDAPQ